jgi:hypothetical protein
MSLYVAYIYDNVLFLEARLEVASARVVDDKNNSCLATRPCLF